MRVLVVGSGGREHALAWAIAASPLVDALYCAPGNAGIADEAECVPIRATDIAGLVGFCRRERIDFVVIGPEAPLVLGLVDALEAEGVPAFGPNAAAAALEGSKGYAKDLCRRAGIPTATHRRFRDPAAAKAFIAGHGAPIVVKADGLAAGKGVTVAADLDTAFRAVEAALVERRFGDAGPNTGGMGACSPTPRLTPALEGAVMERIILPAVAAMEREGRPFKGVLYAGLMLTEAGPMLLEFNVRFGDPEAQVLMMRLMSDPLPALIAARDGVLRSVDLRWHAEHALCVVMAARGYPDEPKRGSEIHGLDPAGSDSKVKIFHAATRRDGERVLADGGRVLGVTALGADLTAARGRAYAAVDQIHWPEGFCRRDIGRRATT